MKLDPVKVIQCGGNSWGKVGMEALRGSGQQFWGVVEQSAGTKVGSGGAQSILLRGDTAHHAGCGEGVLEV